MPAKKNEACRYCGSRKLSLFLSLGQQPPSNSFLRPEQVPQEVRFALDVYLCEECYLVQLLDVVPAEAIFDDYLYLSSSSKALVQHYRGLAQMLIERFKLTRSDMAVDIGCNDGILLHGYGPDGPVTVGVEPSKVADVARGSGLEVFRGFFSVNLAEAIAHRCGKAKVVTATNVFAHVDDSAAFVEGLLSLLTEDGVFVIEAPYLIDMFEQCLFDTIYHEHLCYLSLTPLVPFLARHGLAVFDVERVPFGASGPAIRVFVQRTRGPHIVRDSVGTMLADEVRWGLKTPHPYGRFSGEVQKVREELLALLTDLKRRGAEIGGYGAPAKGNTLLNYLGLTTDLVQYIAETNAWKQGMLTPGSHIPIVSEEEFLARMPGYALLLSWNYLEFFLKHSEFIRKGGRFVVPLPNPRIAP
jgi:SAM-dependent methyltransferase